MIPVYIDLLITFYDSRLKIWTNIKCFYTKYYSIRWYENKRLRKRYDWYSFDVSISRTRYMCSATDSEFLIKRWRPHLVRHLEFHLIDVTTLKQNQPRHGKSEQPLYLRSNTFFIRFAQQPWLVPLSNVCGNLLRAHVSFCSKRLRSMWEYIRQSTFIVTWHYIQCLFTTICYEAQDIITNSTELALMLFCIIWIIYLLEQSRLSARYLTYRTMYKYSFKN